MNIWVISTSAITRKKVMGRQCTETECTQTGNAQSPDVDPIRDRAPSARGEAVADNHGLGH